MTADSWWYRDMYEDLTSDNPDKQRRFVELAPIIASKLSELRETIELRRNEGFDAALQVVLTDKGRAAMDNIRLKTNEIDTEERTLLKERSEDSRASANTTQFIVLYGILFCPASNTSPAG